MVFKDIQTNSATGINVAMVDFCGEVDFRGLEGVITGKMDIEEEYTSLVRAIGRNGE